MLLLQLLLQSFHISLKPDRQYISGVGLSFILFNGTRASEGGRSASFVLNFCNNNFKEVSHMHIYICMFEPMLELSFILVPLWLGFSLALSLAFGHDYVLP